MNRGTRGLWIDQGPSEAAKRRRANKKKPDPKLENNCLLIRPSSSHLRLWICLPAAVALFICGINQATFCLFECDPWLIQLRTHMVWVWRWSHIPCNSFHLRNQIVHYWLKQDCRYMSRYISSSKSLDGQLVISLPVTKQSRNLLPRRPEFYPSLKTETAI